MKDQSSRGYKNLTGTTEILHMLKIVPSNTPRRDKRASISAETLAVIFGHVPQKSMETPGLQPGI